MEIQGLCFVSPWIWAVHMGGRSVDHGAIVPSDSICLAPMLHICMFTSFPCLSFPSLSHSVFLSSLLNLPGLLSCVTSAPTYGESLCTPINPTVPLT